MPVKFIYSEKARKFNLHNLPRIFVLNVVTLKSTVEISQTFVAFSEYMNFNLEMLLCFAEITGMNTKKVNPILFITFSFKGTKYYV